MFIGSLVLLPLLGLTWVFGILAVNANSTLFAWLFTIFNSTQVKFNNKCANLLVITTVLYVLLVCTHLKIYCAAVAKLGIIIVTVINIDTYIHLHLYRGCLSSFFTLFKAMRYANT